MGGLHGVMSKRRASQRALRDASRKVRQRPGIEALRAGDPDWRNLMPLGWRLSRWWDIHWPAALTVVLLAGLIVLLGVITYG